MHIYTYLYVKTYRQIDIDIYIYLSYTIFGYLKNNICIIAHILMYIYIYIYANIVERQGYMNKITCCLRSMQVPLVSSWASVREGFLVNLFRHKNGRDGQIDAG